MSKAPTKKTIRKPKAAVKNTAPSAVRKPTPQQQLFVDEFIVDLNGTQAAIRARYSEKTARQQASNLLTKVYIQDAIAEARLKQQNRTQITADRVLLEVARLAMYDPRKFFNNEGEPLGIHELDDDTAAALAGMEVIEQYENIGDGKREFTGYLKKYKLADKGPNLERLMKHLGLYERDNEQKVDPLTALLHGIATRNAGAFLPVANDPERNESKAQSGFAPVTDDEDHDED